MSKKLLIVHGGGPTAVLNASLYGAVTKAGESDEISEVYGAQGGTNGLLKEKFLRLDMLSRDQLDKLRYTPGTVIGTSRFPLSEADYARMADICLQNGFQYVLFSGGNGTMDTCLKMHRACEKHGILVAGIPKTVDNDISATDHAPGYGSAARFIAMACKEVAEDVRSMPIHVSILEAMGRNAGWITAAAALARKGQEDAPHIICFPERPFDEDAFLQRVETLHQRYGGVVVVASEGLKGKSGEPVTPAIFKSGRATYYGDVGTHLAGLVIRRLGIKARSEKPGILGRASIMMQSPVDREEAVQAGAEAVRSVLEGQSGIMTGFERLSGEPYRMRIIRIPLETAALTERTLPENYIAEDGFDVTPEFLRWARPLIGGPLPEFFAW